MFEGESFGFVIGTILVMLVWLLVAGLTFFCYRKKYKFVALFFLFGWFCISWGLFIEPYRLVVNEFDIKAPQLPTMKIAVVSDFHLRVGKSRFWVERILHKLKQESFDVLVIPGDFLTSSAKKYAADFAPLKQLKQPIFFVTGNHDYRLNGETSLARVDFLRNKLSNFNLKELKNGATKIGENLFLLGVADNYLGFDDVKSALVDTPANSAKILLAHSPDIIDEFDAANYPNLIISGHTHCGQVRLPVLGAVPGVIPTKHGKQYDRHYYPNKNLFVTCGVGESGPAIRFWNPPEINILKVNGG